MSNTSSSTEQVTPRPPRPPNPWILYRRDKQRSMRKHDPNASTDIGVVSKHISKMWKAEDKSVRLYYKNQAADMLADHRIKFPDYKYRPRPRGEPKNIRGKKRYNKINHATAPISVVDDPYVPLSSGESSSSMPVRLPPQLPLQKYFANPSGLWHDLFSNSVPPSSSTRFAHPIPQSRMTQPSGQHWPPQPPFIETDNHLPFITNPLSRYRFSSPQNLSLPQTTGQMPFAFNSAFQGQIPFPLPPQYHAMQLYPTPIQAPFGMMGDSLFPSAPSLSCNRAPGTSFITDNRPQDTSAIPFTRHSVNHTHNSGYPHVYTAEPDLQPSSLVAESFQGGLSPETWIPSASDSEIRSDVFGAANPTGPDVYGTHLFRASCDANILPETSIPSASRSETQLDDVSNLIGLEAYEKHPSRTFDAFLDIPAETQPDNMVGVINQTGPEAHEKPLHSAPSGVTSDISLEFEREVEALFGRKSTEEDVALVRKAEEDAFEVWSEFDLNFECLFPSIPKEETPPQVYQALEGELGFGEELRHKGVNEELLDPIAYLGQLAPMSTGISA